jgi:hypothetical protein
MRLWPKSLKWRTILLTLLGLVAVGGTVVYVWGRPIKNHVREQLEIFGLRDDPHLVTRGLARGEIGPNTSIEELIACHPPDEVLRSGRFVRASYFTDRGGTHVVAVNGRPARASFCALGQHTTIFDHLTREEDRTFTDATPENEPHRSDAVRAGHRAVAGVAGYQASCDYPPYHLLLNETETEKEGR